MLFPYVFLPGSYHRQVVFTHSLHRIAYNAAYAFAVFNKVDFYLPMDMYGVVELRFISVNKIEAVIRSERRDFGDDVFHGMMSEVAAPPITFCQSYTKNIGRPTPAAGKDRTEQNNYHL